MTRHMHMTESGLEVNERNCIIIPEIDDLMFDDEAKLDGVCIVPIACGRFLDEQEFLPLLRDLNSRSARLVLHPADTSGQPLINDKYLDAVLALSRLLYHDRIKDMQNVELIISHSAGVEDFLAVNIGILYYLQHRKMRMGSFLFDYLRGRRLRGEEYIRSGRGQLMDKHIGR